MHNSVLFSFVLSASTFLSYSALAACTANPDCAALGYTKSSCPSGDLIIKCPFNTAKVNCIPQTCESIGKKTCGNICVPNNFTGCCSDSDCAAGQLCAHYSCRYCAVGDIYYSDKTCSPDLISGKTPIGVVGHVTDEGKHGIVVEKNHSSSRMQWGCPNTDVGCVTNKSGTTGGVNPELRADYNGKSNTDCMVSRGCTSGTYCNNRSVEGVTGWYLPAGGELYDTMIENRDSINTVFSKISNSQAIPSAGQDYYYWSSSEYTNYDVWSWDFYDDRWYHLDKVNSCYARCVLAF